MPQIISDSHINTIHQHIIKLPFMKMIIDHNMEKTLWYTSLANPVGKRQGRIMLPQLHPRLPYGEWKIFIWTYAATVVLRRKYMNGFLLVPDALWFLWQNPNRAHGTRSHHSQCMRRRSSWLIHFLCYRLSGEAACREAPGCRESCHDLLPMDLQPCPV